MGNETSPKVKGKVQSLLYSWKIGLPHEPKIAEAYELLKEQGVSPFCDASTVPQARCVCILSVFACT